VFVNRGLTVKVEENQPSCHLSTTSKNNISVTLRTVAGKTYQYQVWDTTACHTIWQSNMFLTVPMRTIILTISKSDFSPSSWHWKQQHDNTHASNFTNEAVHVHKTKSAFSSTFCVLITITTHWNSEIRKGYCTHQLLELFQVILYFCYLHMIPGPYRIGLKGLTFFLFMYRNNIMSVIVLYEVSTFLLMKQNFSHLSM